MPLSLPCPLPKKEHPEINQHSINARKSASGQSVPAHAHPQRNQSNIGRPGANLCPLFPSLVSCEVSSSDAL
ncbi:hypothetical protein V8C43DRAFT_171333 [Trichoderma afarasin]